MWGTMFTKHETYFHFPILECSNSRVYFHFPILECSNSRVYFHFPIFRVLQFTCVTVESTLILSYVQAAEHAPTQTMVRFQLV